MAMIIKNLERVNQLSITGIPIRRPAIFLFFAVWLSFIIKGQNNTIDQESGYALPSESGEKITLFTDRTLYVVSEKIYFTADYAVINELSSLDWSHVLYVELIRWNGEKMVQAKFALNKPGASGYLEIPNEVLSGNYYIRAYTRWMRNYAVGDYAYLGLKIVNPYRQEIDPGSNDMHDVKKHLPESILPVSRIKGVYCSASKTTYRQREQVDLKLMPGREIPGNNDDYCITVVKEGSIDTTYPFPVCSSDMFKPEGVDFLPEIRGISVSGKVFEKSTGNPAADEEIYLAIPISGEYFSVFNTGKQGRFYFTLPYLAGSYDFFVEALTGEETETEIQIDYDFCNVPVTLPYIQFKLNPGEELLVREMMINRQLEEKFTLKPSDDSINKPAVPVVFYGTPQNVLYMEDYIELIDLEEFIFEIVPEIIVYHKKGKPFIRFNRITGLSNLQSLVMIDNLPVTNIEQLLKTPVNKLERIELINQGYVAGNQIFNGLISVYSKNNDFASIEMSKNSMFFNYRLYSDNTGTFPAYEENSDLSRIPDRRNLLYWQPRISLSSGRTTNISFYTSDSKGKYVIYIRNISNRDKPGIYGTCLFTVE